MENDALNQAVRIADFYNFDLPSNWVRRDKTACLGVLRVEGQVPLSLLICALDNESLSSLGEYPLEMHTVS